MLVTNDSIIPSSTGVQQGDPLGPLLFALGVDHVARSVRSPFNVWYLDDATFGGPVDTIVNDIRSVIPALSEIGLEINASKSEVINVNLTPEEFSSGLDHIQETLRNVQITDKNEVFVLGAPILQSAVRQCLDHKRDNLSLMLDRLQSIDAHPALFLLRNCFSLPKLQYTLRSSPCHNETDLLKEVEDCIRQGADEICNIQLDDLSWRQASLPIRYGGIGLRSPLDVAFPACMSSLSSTSTLVRQILSQLPGLDMDGVYTSAIECWTEEGLAIPHGETKQQAWDDAKCSNTVRELTPSLDQHRLACFRTASEPNSGVWLNSVPSASTGTLLDNESLRIGVALRLGLPVCEQHQCRCGATIDRYGLHPLSCRMSTGRFPRHAALNDVVKRALESAGFPSQLEPVGIDRGDGKRPDGITVFPFDGGKSLVWDATCADSYSSGNLVSSATEPGSVSVRAEERKIAKYHALTDRFIFVPVAVETSGIIGPKATALFRRLGARLARQRNEPRETTFLFQRISVAIVRGNALAITTAGIHRRPEES